MKSNRQLASIAVHSVMLCWGSCFADDVPWLSEVTSCPNITSVANFAGRIEPLLVNKEGQRISTIEGWKKQRAHLLKRWNDFLGPMPRFEKTDFEVIRTEVLSKVVRKRIRYEYEPGLSVDAFLLIPKGKHASNSLPGIVGLHQTTTATFDEIAGVSGPEQQQLGIRLARRGFVVICPKNYLWVNAPKYLDAVRDFKTRHPKAVGMRKMLYDSVRALDILESLDIVDPNRLGAIGHSLGAKETLYLAAFDQRIKAAVASEGGTAFKSTNWNAPWYLGKQIDNPDFALNHHQVLALIAPRPFLIMGGEKGRGAADGLRSWPLIKPAQDVYRLFKQPVRLGLLNHGQGHSVPKPAFNQAAEWLDTYLSAAEVQD